MLPSTISVLHVALGRVSSYRAAYIYRYSPFARYCILCIVCCVPVEARERPNVRESERRIEQTLIKEVTNLVGVVDAVLVIVAMCTHE